MFVFVSSFFIKLYRSTLWYVSRSEMGIESVARKVCGKFND